MKKSILSLGIVLMLTCSGYSYANISGLACAKNEECANYTKTILNDKTDEIAYYLPKQNAKNYKSRYIVTPHTSGYIGSMENLYAATVTLNAEYCGVKNIASTILENQEDYLIYKLDYLKSCEASTGFEAKSSVIKLIYTNGGEGLFGIRYQQKTPISQETEKYWTEKFRELAINYSDLNK